MLISLVPLPSSKTLFVWKSSKKLNSSNISPLFKMQRRRAATCWVRKMVKCRKAFSPSPARHVAPKFPGWPCHLDRALPVPFVRQAPAGCRPRRAPGLVLAFHSLLLMGPWQDLF